VKNTVGCDDREGHEAGREHGDEDSQAGGELAPPCSLPKPNAADWKEDGGKDLHRGCQAEHTEADPFSPDENRHQAGQREHHRPEIEAREDHGSEHERRKGQK
jgi:hypothetical protein